MSDLLDERAVEAREEGQEDDGLPDDEAEASYGDSDGSGGSSDEEEEEGDEDKQFIAKEGEEEEDGDEKEGEEGEEERRKKKKRRHRELVLEEEDYELLEENTGVRQVRPSGHRRLKKARDMGGEAAQRDAAAALQAELFGEEGGAGLGLEDDMEDAGAGDGEGGAGGADAEEGRPAAAGDDGDDFRSSDEDDWIVNEFEEEGEGGAGARRERRRRGPLDPALAGVDAAALAEAQDIFGDVDELMEIYQASKARAGAGGAGGAGGDLEEPSDGEDDVDPAELEGLSEDEAEEVRRGRRAERRAAAAARRLQAQLEPGAVERHYLLASDAVIREADVPERETLTRGPDPAAFDLDACADWVCEQLADSGDWMIDKARELVEEGVREVEGPPPAWMGVASWRPLDEEGRPVELLRGGLEDVSSHRGLFEGRQTKQERRAWRAVDGAQAALRDAVRAALSRIYEAHEEVPVVGMYRKELLGELLALRGSDEPGESEHPTDPFTGEPNPLAGVVKAGDRRSRRWEVLYAVQRLAQRWRALQRAKEARQTAYEAALAEAASAEDRDAVLACLQALPAVRLSEGLDDLDAKFKLAMSVAEAARGGAGAAQPEDDLAELDLGEEGDEEGQGGAGAPPGAKPLRLKAATRRGGAAGAARRLALAAGLRPLADALGLSAAQFAESVKSGWKVHEPQDPSLSPLELAAQFVDPGVPACRDAEQALRAAAAVLEAEIAAQPAVRAAARAFVARHVAVTTHLTAAGATALTPFHPLGIAKRLRGKPLADFMGDAFLRVLQAEEAKLVHLDYALEAGVDAAAALPPDLFLSGGVGPEAQAWNDLRAGILRRVLAGGLIKEALAGVRAQLAADARGAVALQLSEAAWKLAARAPLVLHNEEGEPVAEPRIMAAVWGPGTPPTTLVVLDASGGLVDYLHCPQLSGAIPRPKALPGQVVSSFTDPKKAKDAAAVRAFIEAHTPHAIVVGVAHCEALNLKEEIKGVLDQILADNPRVIRSVETGIVVVPGAEGVAALWENCAAAREELPAAAAVVRRGVAVAREALEPLAVLAAVAGPGREVLSLPLHPLQAVVPADERVRVWEEALVTATAQAGVDVNAAAAAPWRAAPLAFVPGLGPRKAQALLRAVTRSGGALESRRALLEDLGALGPTVFANAAPALRVRPSTKAAANLDIAPLDDTRVHPESYALAVALAQSAAPGAEEDVAVEHAMAAPEEVATLELSTYDEHLRGLDAGEDGGGGAPGPPALAGGTRLATLIDAQFELIAPYGELRRGVDASDEEALWGRNPQLLYWATGQGAEGLRPGRRVEAKVRWVGAREARLTVPELNDLEATLLAGDVSSSRDSAALDCRDFLQRGATVAAVIKEVRPEEREVLLATSSAALNSEAYWEAEYLARDEDAYVAPSEKEIAQERAAAAGAGAGGAGAAGAKRQVKRRIRHPLFQNLSMADAAAAVRPDVPDGDGAAAAEPPVGTAIVRPGKSSSGLYITMRMPGDLVWHCAVKEEGRVGRDLALAPPLAVEPLPGQGATYDDLDELDARFVSPLAAALRALCAHRKWRGGGGGQRPVAWDEAREMLLAERRHAQTVPYLLAADDRRPGAFYIGSLVSATPRREFFVALPDGFYFRKKVYSTVDAMLAAFKKAPRPPAAEAEARPPAPAAPPPPAPYAPPQPYMDPQQQYYAQQQQQWGAYNNPTNYTYGATVPDQQWPGQGQGGAGYGYR